MNGAGLKMGGTEKYHNMEKIVMAERLRKIVKLKLIL